MKTILIILISIVMTTTNYALGSSPEQIGKQLNFFTGTIDIPEGYAFKSSRKVVIDGINAILFRYTKNTHDDLKEEHFSFIVTENEPYKILGFTFMDSEYATDKQLSKQETEDVARQFLKKIDPELDRKLSNMWIDQHDEEIFVDGEQKIVSGMKYKCYSDSDDNYAWVIVGFDGTLITFERDIIWNDGMQKRITEKWLHDNWLADRQNAGNIE